MPNPWFRLYSEFMHDPKVQMMSEQDQRRLVMIFCMRCNSDVTLQDCHVTFQLRISQSEWECSKAVFIASGFMDSDNKILNWDKRQFISDTSRDRVARHRALHKTLPVTVCNVTVTPPEQIQNRTDTEKPLARTDKKPSVHAVQFDAELGEFKNLNGQLEVWQKAYPAVAIEFELKKAGAWLLANPKNIKSNYARFLNNWLSKAQDKAPAQKITGGKFDLNEFMKARS